MARYPLDVSKEWAFKDEKWLRFCVVCNKRYEWEVHQYKEGYHHNRCPKHREQFVQRQADQKKRKKYRVLLPRYLR